MADLSQGRYLLFCWKQYSTGGGWSHAEARSDDLDSLIAAGKAYSSKHDPDEPCAEVVDLTTGLRAWES
jgi:hypothetical protein